MLQVDVAAGLAREVVNQERGAVAGAGNRAPFALSSRVGIIP